MARNAMSSPTPIPGDPALVVRLLEQLVEASTPKLAVGSREAARRLGIGLDRLAALRERKIIATVPYLSTPKKVVYAVRELERVAALGIKR
jgi:hypothetical protein